MKKFLVLTDIHKDYDAARSAYTTENPDFVLDCGDHDDIVNIAELTPHFYISGNHEPITIRPTEDGMPLPFLLQEGITLEIPYENNFIRIGGIGGNYASSTKMHSVDTHSLDYLKKFKEKSLDILLMHESPFNLSDESPYVGLAKEVIREVERISPKYVFAGHSGEYSTHTTDDGIHVINLDDMFKGYGVLTLDGNDFSFVRKKAQFPTSR